MKKLNVEKKITKKTMEKIVGSEISKSAKIRDLFDGGVELKTIAELLDIRYNFVYNVISNYALINDIEIEKTNKTSKKDEVARLHTEGLKPKEIAKELKTNINYVYKIIKELRSATEEAKDEAAAE